jgi:cell volume regulation protein A
VPIILATFPYLAGLPEADLYFNVVFFIVLTSVLLQGTTLTRAARLLGLDTPLPPNRRYPLEFVSVGKTNSELLEVAVPEDSSVHGNRIMDLSLPDSALVVLIARGEDFIAPRGGTTIAKGDTLLVLADKEQLPMLRNAIEGRGRTGDAEG